MSHEAPGATSAIDAVVFDIGGVLIDYDPRYLYSRLIDDRDEMEHFLAEVCTAEWNHQQDLGRSFADGIAERIALFPDKADLIRAWDSRWQEMVPGPIEGTVAILEALKASGMPIFAITNFSREKFAEAQERFAFLTHFRDVVVSAHEHLAKPDPAIYHVALERFGIDPARAVFIDDMPANVETAKTLGFNALRFTGPQAFRNDLAALGVPTPA